MSNHVNPIKRYPTSSFYLLAFAVSWLGWIPQALNGRGLIRFDSPLLNLLAGLGPTIAAIIVLLAAGEKGSVRRLFRALVKVRAPIRWYAFVFGFWIAVAALALACGAAFGQRFSSGSALPWFSLPLVFVGMLLSNVWEEIGWRGFALPRFKEKYSNLTISLVMGFLWSLWHVPLMLNPTSPMAGLPWYGEFIFSVSLTVVYTWLYENTDRSLFFVTVFHALSNTAAFALLQLGAYASSYFFVVGISAISAIAIVFVSGWKWASQAPVIAAEGGHSMQVKRL